MFSIYPPIDLRDVVAAYEKLHKVSKEEAKKIIVKNYHQPVEGDSPEEIAEFINASFVQAE
ncbi:MAG: hypothetical protein AAFO95_10360 [Cyanobacteria bacterium J06600_6]